MGSVSNQASADKRTRTPTEEIVAGIWAAELRLPSIGLDEDFIDLGSHSLQGVAVVARLEEHFGLTIPVRVLFEEPTVADLAAWIDRHRSDGEGDKATFVQLQEGSGLRPIFAVPGGQADAVRLYGLGKLARAADSRRPFYAFPGDPRVSMSIPTEAWMTEAAVILNEQVRSIQPTGPYLLLGVCMGGLLIWEMARQLEERGEAVELFLVDTAHPRLQIRTRKVRKGETPELTGADRRALVRMRRWRREQRKSDARVFSSEIAKPLPGVGAMRKTAANAYEPEPLTANVRLLVNADWHRMSPSLGWDTLLGDRLSVAKIGKRHGLHWHLPQIAAELVTWLDDVDPHSRGTQPTEHPASSIEPPAETVVAREMMQENALAPSENQKLDYSSTSLVLTPAIATVSTSLQALEPLHAEDTNGLVILVSSTTRQDERRRSSWLSRKLGQERPVLDLVVPLQRGRSDRNLRDRRMQAARTGVLATRDMQPHGPYLVIGLTDAGAIAFDLAAKLEQEGEAVRLLLIEAWHPARGADVRRRSQRHNQGRGGQDRRSARRSTIARAVDQDPIEWWQQGSFSGAMTLIASHEALEEDMTLGWGTMLGENLTVFPAKNYQRLRRRKAEFTRAVRAWLDEVDPQSQGVRQTQPSAAVRKRSGH